MPYAMTAALIICTLSFALFALFALAGYKAFYLGESTSVSKPAGVPRVKASNASHVPQ